MRFVETKCDLFSDFDLAAGGLPFRTGGCADANCAAHSDNCAANAATIGHCNAITLSHADPPAAFGD